ncbi:MAG: nitroreductase family protein [Candidatus Poribacteria bacterium]|nr:nitroreductase family protein [Candidatus Poribacteria bacterium]
MSVLDLIRRRRSHYGDFLDLSITQNDLDALIEAARWAPSPFNIQPWELVFVTDSDQKAALGKATREAMASQFKDESFLKSVASWTRLDAKTWQQQGDGVFLGDQLPDSTLAKTVAPLVMKHTKIVAALGKLGGGNGPGRMMEALLVGSPLLMVVLRNRERVSPGDNGEAWTHYSFGAMFQNLLLAATERDIGSQFVNMAFERGDDRERIRQLLNAPESREPLLLFRFGYLDPRDKLSVRLPKEQIVHHDRYHESDSKGSDA